MESVRVVRVDPKSLGSQAAYAPLEQLGKVSVEEIESKIGAWREPKATLKQGHAAGSAARDRRLKKEAALMEIASALGEFTARQLWEAYQRQGCVEGKCHISSIQIFLKKKADAGELLLIQRWEKVKGKPCCVHYYRLTSSPG